MFECNEYNRSFKWKSSIYEAFNDGHPVSRNRRQYANNGVLFGDYRRNYTVFGNGMIDLSFNEFFFV